MGYSVEVLIIAFLATSSILSLNYYLATFAETLGWFMIVYLAK